MAISHVKSVTIADFTGTVTVFNSAGATTTANATDIVRPTDWNSVHNQYFTLTGNTNNASTASGSNVVLSGGNGVTLIGSNSRIGFSVADQSVQTQNMVSVQGSTGAVVFSNSNGITFGGNASTITASHNGLTTARASNDAIGLNTAITQNGVSMTANSSGLSLNFPAFLTTAALSNHSHGNPTLNLTNLSGTTASNSAGLTLSLSAAAPGAATLTLSATGNTTQSSTGTIAGSSMLVRGSGGVSAGISNGSIIVEGPGLTSLSATGALSASSNGSTISLGVGTVTVSATSNTVTTNADSSGTVNLNALVFQGVGGASVGLSNGSIVISGNTGGGAGYSAGVSTGGNTSGDTGVVTGRLVLAGGANVTLSGSTNAGSMTVSISAGTAAAAPVNISAGTTSNNLDTIVFSNSNGVSFGLNGSTITASAVGGGGVGMGVSTMGNTAGTTGTVTTGNVALVGSGVISLSQSSSGSNATISILAPATSSLVAGTNITISTAGSTITIIGASVGAAPITVSAGTASVNAGAFTFADSNGISFGLGTGASSGSITASHNGLTSQTVQTQSNVQGIIVSDTTYRTGDVSFSNANGISFGSSAGQAITASYTVPTQSAQTIGLYASSQTTGQSSSSTVDARSITLVGQGNISVGLSGGSFLISQTGGGGGIAASLSGNSTSGGAGYSNITSGTMILAGGNNITLSQDGSRITISGADVGGAQTGISSVALSDTTYTSGQISFRDLNGITWQSTTGQAIQITHGLQYTSNTSAITSNAMHSTSRPAFSADASSTFQTLTLQNSNGISFSNNAGAIRITHDLQYTSATSAITSAALHTSASRVINIVAATNNTGGGTASLSSDVSFSAANGLTFYTSAGGAVVGSHNALTSQSNQAFSAGAASSTFQTLTFQDSNGVSFSNNAGAIRVTHALAGTGTTVATSNQGLSMTLNSAGLNISATGLNQAVSNSAGSFTFQTLNFSNANNVTWGTSAGNIITASVAAPGAAAENNWMNLLGANTSGNTTASGSTIGLSGINMTLSGTNGSVVNLSVPATSSLSATGQVSISTNGSTISIGVPGDITYSYFNPQDAYVQVTGQQGQSTLHIQPAKFPNLQFDRWAIPIVNTNSSNSSGSHTISFHVGLYSNNAGTLSRVFSTSSSTGVTHSGTAGSYSLYSGIRLFTIPQTTTVTEGQYWIGVLSMTTSGGANGSYSQILASQQNSSFFGHFGVAVNKSIQYTRGLGILSVQTAALPSAVNFTDLSGASNSLVLRQPILYMVSGTF